MKHLWQFERVQRLDASERELLDLVLKGYGARRIGSMTARNEQEVHGLVHDVLKKISANVGLLPRSLRGG